MGTHPAGLLIMSLYPSRAAHKDPVTLLSSWVQSFQVLVSNAIQILFFQISFCNIIHGGSPSLYLLSGRRLV